MRKNMFTYGLIMGAIIAIQMVVTINICYQNSNWEPSEIVGWLSMIIVSSLIFIGVRNYRNKYQDGIISFAKAFKLGAGMALIAATIYVITWLVFYYCFVPDFMEKYSQHVLNMAAKNGATAAEIAEETSKMKSMSDMYKNPLFVILLTYAEILPLALVVSLVSALILKRKPDVANNSAAIGNE
jgi:ethanolamine transporter EutH